MSPQMFDPDEGLSRVKCVKCQLDAHISEVHLHKGGLYCEDCWSEIAEAEYQTQIQELSDGINDVASMVVDGMSELPPRLEALRKVRGILWAAVLLGARSSSIVLERKRRKELGTADEPDPLNPETKAAYQRISASLEK